MPGWSMPFCPFRLYAVFTPHHANPLATAHFSLWKYQSRTEALPGLQYLLLRRFLSRGGHRFCLVFNGSVPQLPWTSKFGVKTGDFLWDEWLAWKPGTSAEALRYTTATTGFTTLHQGQMALWKRGHFNTGTMISWPEIHPFQCCRWQYLWQGWNQIGEVHG